MTALLVRREVLVPHAQPAVPSVPAELRTPTDNWMGIYSKNEAGGEDRVGYVHLTSAPGHREADAGTRYGMTFRLATTMLSMPTELLLDGSAWVVDGKGLSDFEFRVQSFGEHVMKAKGEVRDGRAKLEVETAGETFPLDFPVGQDLLLQGGFGATSLNMPSLEIGDTVLIDAFDPTTMTKGTARVECVGIETLKFDEKDVPTKILTTELGGVTTKTWVGLDDEVMRVETPIGLVLRRVSQSEALRTFDAAGESSELIRAVAVRPSGARPFRGATQMHFRLSAVAKKVIVPVDDVQRRIALDEFQIDAATAPGSGVLAADPAAFQAELAADPFVPTGHAKIARQSREIVGEETDPWRKAQRIYAWVYENIEKTPVLSLPSALDVLESRQGDCNEHTVLYAALARTEGVPTRIAIGLVWSDELAGFYYHAWPEVFVGRWIPVDPTLGQPVADATHIKLLEGSVGQWPRLVPFLGQVKIDVLEIR
jgi:transglutaminase-like putative cysteine protease